MDTILVSSVIITIVVILVSAGLIFGNRYISNNYDEKIKDVLNQVNDVHKSSYNYTQKHGLQLESQGNTQSNLSNETAILSDTNIVLDEKLSQLTSDYSKYYKKNRDDLVTIQDKMNKMPWDHQISNMQDLEKRVGKVDTSITNIKQMNTSQDKDIQNLKNYSTSSANDIKSLQSEFYDISGKYVTKSSLSNTLTNYPTTTTLNSALVKVNDSLASISTSLNTIPKTYSTISVLNNVQGALNQAKDDASTLKQRILNLESTYISKNDLLNAQLSSNQNADKALNTAINSLQMSITNVVKQISTLPQTLVDPTDYANLKTKVNNLNNSLLQLLNDRWITTTDGKNRVQFGTNNRTYFGSQNGYEFRNANDQSITTIDNNGVISIVGNLTTPQLCIGSTCLTENDLKKAINPVDCQVSGWSGWSGCSVSCGGGTQTQTRTVTQQPQRGGASCPSLSQSQQCNTQACPVNCQVSGWSGCSASCGGGWQSRSITQQPANGGAGCPSLSQQCNTQACPVNCPRVSGWCSHPGSTLQSFSGSRGTGWICTDQQGNRGLINPPNCSSDWPYANLSVTNSDSKSTVAVNQAAVNCPRVSGWCSHAGSILQSFSGSQGTGWICTDTYGNRGLINPPNCASDWPSANFPGGISTNVVARN